MLKKILLLSTIIFTSNLATAASFAEKEEQQRIAAGKIHGMFNLYKGFNSELAITQAQPQKVYSTSKETQKNINDYVLVYSKQKTTEQKAKFAYQFMTEIATQAKFTAFKKKDHNGNFKLDISVYINNKFLGIGFDLIPTKDMKAVFPKLLKLIKTQDKVSVKSDSISSKYYQIIDGTMTGLFAWPQGEDWFPSWESWISDELAAICYTSDGEETLCTLKDYKIYDYNEDNIPDEICGRYEFYFGGGDHHFHCRANN